MCSVQKIMIRFICFAVLFSSVVATTVVKNMTWQNCDENAPVLIKKLTVKPNPIPLVPGAKLTVSGVLNLKYTISLTIKRKFLFWWPTIPCIDSYGSCTYEIGQQKIPPQTITIPNISLPAIIVDGKYKVKEDIIENVTGNRLFCIDLTFEIA